MKARKESGFVVGLLIMIPFLQACGGGGTNASLVNPPVSTPVQPIVRAILPPSTTAAFPSGMSINLPIPAGDPTVVVPAMKQAGFRWVRMGMEWSDVEKQKGVYTFDAPGNGNTKNFDLWRDTAKANGVGILLNVRGENDLYPSLTGHKPFDSAGRTNFTNFAAAAAREFAGCQVMLELFNEPNLQESWPMDSDGDGTVTTAERQKGADDYASLVAVAIPGMLAADPNAYIVGLALSQNAGGRPAAEIWLRELRLNPLNVLPLFNAVTIHFYQGATNQNAEMVVKDLANWRDILTNGSASLGVPFPQDHLILSGEMGYPLGMQVGGTTGVTETDQARYLIRTYLMFAAASATTAGEAVVFHNWFDWSGTNTAFNIKGLKGQIAALTLSTTLTGYTFAESYPAPWGSTDYRIRFSNGVKDVQAIWTSAESDTPHTLTDLPAGIWKAVNSVTGTVDSTFTISPASPNFVITPLKTPEYLVQQ